MYMLDPCIVFPTASPTCTANHPARPLLFSSRPLLPSSPPPPSSSSSLPSISMLYSSLDAVQEAPLRMRQDDKFYCRLLAKESPSGPGAGTPSFRVYYGVASSAVPFLWESQPGTPKHLCSSGASGPALPPLTPPPSYQCSSPRTAASPRKASQGSNLVRTILLRLFRRKSSGRAPPSPRSSISSSSSSSSSPPTRSSPRHGRLRRSSSARSPFSSVADEEEPAMCFGVRHGSYLGCCKMVSR